MAVLALETVPADADFSPVVAHFTLIFFRLGERNHLAILHEARHRGALGVES